MRKRVFLYSFFQCWVNCSWWCSDNCHLQICRIVFTVYLTLPWIKILLPSIPLQSENHRCWIYADVTLKSGLIRAGETQRDSCTNRLLIIPRILLNQELLWSRIKLSPCYLCTFKLKAALKCLPFELKIPRHDRRTTLPPGDQEARVSGSWIRTNFTELSWFLSAGGEEWQQLLVWYYGRNCKKSVMLMTMNKWRGRKSQQTVSPDGIFPKYETHTKERGETWIVSGH